METQMDSMDDKSANDSTKRPKKQVIHQYQHLVDKELDQKYPHLDSIDKYCNHFHKVFQNGRYYYHCNDQSCHFSTNKSSIAVRHIRRHINEKPYKCWLNNCGQQFYQKCELRVHVIRHMEDKPFKCTQNNCIKSYTNRKALSLHLKSHSTLEYHFDCNLCPKRFVTKWLLNKHLKDRHSNNEMIGSKPLSVTDANSHPIAKTIDMIKKIKLDIKPKPVTNNKVIITKSKQEIRSKENISTNLSDYGFEEVIKYVIKNKRNNKPLVNEINHQNLVENCHQLSSNHNNDHLPHESPLDMTFKCCQSMQMSKQSLNENSNQKSVNLSNKIQKEMSELLFGTCVDSIESLIEIKSSKKLFRSENRFIFQCFVCEFNSVFTNDIIEHISQHLSHKLTECLTKRCQEITNDFIIAIEQQFITSVSKFNKFIENIKH
ncbi:zinc finger protein 717-like [Oppia nitens]|uniref:zinc finger protein 717-like n=1 Tax=Oppia nitens TaxID=1686743 RepID=UPI0023D9BBD9|nr:zinc finger protein 717-like [Oppia nitens]